MKGGDIVFNQTAETDFKWPYKIGSINALKVDEWQILFVVSNFSFNRILKLLGQIKVKGGNREEI